MQFLLFVVAISVVVGIIGFGAWAIAQSFVYLTKKTHKVIVFAVNRVFVPTFHYLNAVVENLKAMRLAKAKATARSEETVIEQQDCSFESVKTEEVDQSLTQPPMNDESEVDYDIPTYLRKGKVLVW